jgi:anti-sigma regulatory factor (Ser/Thr protein kinase)
MRHSGRRPVAQAPDVVDVDQAFDVDGLYALRETLAAHAGRLGATDDQVDDLLIVAGELATNAVRHGGGVGRLRLWHRGGVLYCQVSDHGPGITDPAVGTTHPDSTGRDGGRGVWICRNIATELIIDTGPDGRGAIVTAVIPR